MAPGVAITDWLAWFTNNPERPGWTVYDSQSRPFDALPRDGMEGAVLFLEDENGHKSRQMLSGQISYFQWNGPDGLVMDGDPELPDKVAIRYPGASIVRGRSVTLDVIRQIEAEMVAAKEPCANCG